MSSNQKKISWVIDRFEDGKAVLEGEAGNLIISRKHLPANSKEGDVLSADFFLLEKEKERRANLARSILEEILNSN